MSNKVNRMCCSIKINEYVIDLFLKLLFNCLFHCLILLKFLNLSCFAVRKHANTDSNTATQPLRGKAFGQTHYYSYSYLSTDP